MTAPLRLILFDVDGTLVDSQGDILASMEAAFAAVNMAPLPREKVLSIVGLSLDIAIPRLAPQLDEAAHEIMVEAYKARYAHLRATKGAGSSPFYPGVMQTLKKLAQRDEYLLGVATGKSRRGLTALLESHGLTGFFVTEQVADHHPSKPHPSMVLTAMAETGVELENTVVIGDTRFDMEMARAAKTTGIGVSWGYHPARELRALASVVLDQFDELPVYLDKIWKDQR